MSSRLKLELLGGCRFTLGGKVLDVPIAKSRALLVYLAVTGSIASREVLTHLLWSENTDGAARNSLRVRLNGLRQLLPDHLRVSRESVALNPDSSYELDTTSFLEALQTPEDGVNLQKAANLYRGDFLKGFHVANAPVFDEWLMRQREVFRGRILATLQHLTHYHEEYGDYGKAKESLTRYLALEPWLEEAHQQLMRVLALTGQREAAITQYFVCCRVLADELGLEPNAETTGLYERIRAGEVRAPTHELFIARELAEPVAERRQLTVMSCELVGVGAFSDPEELHEHISLYHQTVSSSVAAFEGLIAARQGTTIMAYFGFPAAHEDDPLRAIYTALALKESLQILPQGLRVRVGVSTGVVVVKTDAVGIPEVVGLTPVAAQSLQRTAEPDEILISAATERLIQGYFEAVDKGYRQLENLAEPLEVYRVLKVTAARSRLQARPPSTELVGRTNELSGLVQAWEGVRLGYRQAVLISGEAGIGKSRLLHTLKEKVVGESVRWLTGSCSAYQVSSSFHPLVGLLERDLGFNSTDSPEEKLDKLEAAFVPISPSDEIRPLLAALLALPYTSRYPPLNLSPERQRQKTLEVLVAWLTLNSSNTPTILVVEDLHWCDPSTLELLGLLVEGLNPASFLLLLTARPGFDPDWGGSPNLRQLQLDNLSSSDTALLIAQLAGSTNLPPEVRTQLIAKSDGIPLYVEELTKGVLESDWLARRDQESLSVPSTLQDALTARLDRLGEAKGVAQLAAVIGRDFSLDLLTASSSLPATAIERSLNQLASKGLIYEGPDGLSYRFKHALIQDTAYVSLLKRQRREHHARVAKALSEEMPQKAEQQPALLAQHYSAAGLSTEAIRSWQEAAAQAVIRSAHREAVQHYRAALRDLEDMPVTPESRELQLTLLLGLGGALHTVRGYAAAEVESVFRQARELCQTAEPSPELFEVLLGLAGYYTMRAQYSTAEELVRQLFGLPQRLLTPPRLGGLHFMASRLNGSQGRFQASLKHAQSVLSLRSSSPSPRAPHGLLPRRLDLLLNLHPTYLRLARVRPQVRLRARLQSSHLYFRPTDFVTIL